MILVVFTGESPEQILAVGGSRSWVLSRRRASQCEYVVCTQNRQVESPELKPSEEHGSAFLVGKISAIVPSPRTRQSASHKVGYLIKISEYVLLRPAIPNVWDGNRNPVRYKESLEELKIDPTSLNFKPMPKAHKNQLGEQESFG